MNKKIKKRVIITVIALALLVPAVIFIYPSITGSTVIEGGFLEEDNWVLTNVSKLDNGVINYYNRGEDEELIIRKRTFDTKSDALNLFAKDYNLKYTHDPEYIDYKDLSFASIFFYKKMQIRGPWLTLFVLDGNTLTEFIYANQDNGQEYSGDYDKDLAWLKEVAVGVLGE